MSFDLDAEVNSGLQLSQSAADQDKIAAIQTGDKVGATKGEDMPVKDWMANLPKNVTVGVMDAAANTVQAAKVFGQSTWEYWNRPNETQQAYNEGQGEPKNGGTWEDLRERTLAQPAVQETHGPIQQAYQSFRDELASGSTTSDNVTQSIAQFAIPMLGWSKLLGVQKAISVAGFGAEALTASTALDPHAGRNADLVAYGKTVEGKLGQTLSEISPDGSALNAYINYMTDRTGESDTEGRFKNVIDSLVTTASGAALLKTGATAIKVGRQLPGYIAENAGGGPVGLGAQEGKIVFHGTGSNFDEFDSSKIGSGEGNQAYGHGLYFAENPDTANTYRRMLAKTTGDQSMYLARSALDSSRGDAVKAYKSLSETLNGEPDATRRDVYKRAASLVKSGAARQRGSLMHVDIADEHIENMLDWDKPLSEQPDALKNLQKIGVDPGNETHAAMTGKDIYRSFEQRGFTPKGVSNMFNEAGIPGIKYLDQGSRGKSEGTRNIVLFDAKHAKIVKKE